MPNQWTKAKETGIPYCISDETRKKLSAKTTAGNNKRWSDPLNREKQSERMKLAVQDHPESYTSSNRGRTKQIEKYGIKFQGSWELAYYEYCLQNNIRITRCTERFPYEWNGTRTYNPDFFLEDTGEYVEVKGYETERDRAKWSAFPHPLLVIKQKDINRILATLA